MGVRKLYKNENIIGEQAEDILDKLNETIKNDKDTRALFNTKTNAINRKLNRIDDKIDITEKNLRGEIKESETRLRGEIKESETRLRDEIHSTVKESETRLRGEIHSAVKESESNILNSVDKKIKASENNIINTLVGHFNLLLGENKK